MAAKKTEDKKERGQAYLKDLLSRVPEEKRASVVETLEANEEVLTFLGEGVLRQSDYSRAMDAAREEKEKASKLYEDNINWRAEQKAAADQLIRDNATLSANLKKALAAKATLDLDDDDDDGTGSRNHRTPGVEYLSKEDFDKALAERVAQVETQGLSVMSALTKLSTKHIHEFGEPLDTDELLAHATKNKMRLDEAYRDLTRDQAEEKAQKAIDAKIEAAREEGRQKAIEEARRNGSAPPYPIGNTEPSLHEQIKADKAQYGAKAAIDEYYKSLQSSSS